MIDYGAVANKRRLQFRYGVKGFEAAIIIPQIGFGSGDDLAYKDSLSYEDNTGNTLLSMYTGKSCLCSFLI